MSEIIGIVGPSGVGKGYYKQEMIDAYPGIFVEPLVATTRSRRKSDSADRLAGLSLEEFQAMQIGGEIIFAHQPFGSDGDWYGFVARSIEHANGPILTEIHVDNISPFKERYASRISLIGLVAGEGYLKSNLKNRESETITEQRKRLNAAVREMSLIRRMHTEGLVDELFEVTVINRSTLSASLIGVVSKFLCSANGHR